MEQLVTIKKIYLIGMMGSGKSHWASRLGHHYGLPAYDLDHLLEQAAAKSIREIFEEEGEAAFRKMESEMLVSGVPDNNFILATGGGTPCFFDNISFMKKTGIVIWLNPSTSELVKRLSKGIDSRPVLEGIQSPEALADHLEKLLQKRNSWYSQADIVIKEDVPVLNDFIKEIMQFEHTQA